jgi:hypothetical protein
MNIHEKQISDWTYKYDISKNRFDIIPDTEIIKPQSLYKYFPFSDYAIDSLYHSYLYASHPDQFNDLYDCYINVFQLSKERERNIQVNFYQQNQRDLSPELCKYFLRSAIFMKHGLVSMTERGDDVLMWSYYSSNKGFAIEFDYELFPFNYHGPFPIHYCKNFQNIKIENDLDDKFLVAYMSNIKSSRWKREKEWRFIIDAPKDLSMFVPDSTDFKELGGHDRKFDYPIKAIKCVLLGNSFFKNDKTNRLNNQTLEITLKENSEKKSKILDFLFQHQNQYKFKVKIIIPETRVNTFKLDFREGNITKFGNDKYQFEAID